MSRVEHLELIKEAARTFSLDWTIVDAIVQAESNYNTWAVRNEPAFRRKYIDPLSPGQLHDWNSNIGRTVTVETERDQESKSWGLMQIMGVVAREHGFGSPFLTQLCEPRLGLFFGCKQLRKLLNRYGGNMESALEAYNAGQEDPTKCTAYARRILDAAQRTKEKEGYAESTGGSGVIEGVCADGGERVAERERDLAAVAV